jgi:hypothetical protein
MASWTSHCRRYSTADISASPLGAAAGVSPHDDGRGTRWSSWFIRSSSFLSHRLNISQSLYSGCASSSAGRARGDDGDDCDDAPIAPLLYHWPPRLKARWRGSARRRCSRFEDSRLSRLDVVSKCSRGFGPCLQLDEHQAEV